MFSMENDWDLIRDDAFLSAFGAFVDDCRPKSGW